MGVRRIRTATRSNTMQPNEKENKTHIVQSDDAHTCVYVFALSPKIRLNMRLRSNNLHPGMHSAVRSCPKSFIQTSTHGATQFDPRTCHFPSLQHPSGSLLVLSHWYVLAHITALLPLRPTDGGLGGSKLRAIKQTDMQSE